MDTNSIAGHKAISVSDTEEEWTINYLIDRLKQNLAQCEEFIERDGIKIPNRKYYYQAYSMLGMGAMKPVPPYIIYLSDLDIKIKKEIISLTPEGKRFVLRQSVGRIFEDINSQLFHDGISSVLKVKFH